MKKLLLSCMCVLAGISAMAQSELLYTLEPVKGSNNAYASNCDVEINNVTWNVEGNSQQLPWRLGGKNLNGVERAVTGKNAIIGDMTKVVLTTGDISLTVNKATLVYANNEEFNNATSVEIENLTANAEHEIMLTAPSGSFYKFVFNVTNSTKDNKFVGFAKAEFYGTLPADMISAPEIGKKGGAYYGAQEVTITAEEGCSIYYTLDGTEPTAESTPYTAPVKVSESVTLKAVAVKGDKKSPVSSEAYTILTTVMTLTELQEEASSKDALVAVNVEGWICTGASASNVFFTDGNGLGILVYAKNHGFKAGDKLSGIAVATLCLYGGAAELKDLTATTEGLTIAATDQAVPVLEKKITDLSAANQGALIVVKNVIYRGGAFYHGEGTDALKPYKTLMTLPEFEEGKAYDITGVAGYYNAVQINPRSEQDINLHTGIKNLEGTKVSVDGKFLQNGSVVVVKDGKAYNTAGQCQK